MPVAIHEACALRLHRAEGRCLAIAFAKFLSIVAAACICACVMSQAAFAEEGDASTSSASSESSESAKSSSQASAGANADDADENDKENRVDPTQRADNSFIYDTTIDSLFGQATLYEGGTVQVVGEVIGDLISAGREGEREMYWITLTSIDVENKATISVLLSGEQAKQIDHYGRYGVTGTILQVRGTFHQACGEHQGLPDIHATNSSPIARGIEHPDQFVFDDFVPGIIVVIIGAALLGVYYFVRERSR